MINKNNTKIAILHRLKTGEKLSTTPTIGFNVETIKMDNLRLCVWDVGGQDRLRPLWRQYYAGTTGIIFFVDANDIPRLPLVKDEIHYLMTEIELKYAIMAIVANKQDLPNAIKSDEITKELELTDLKFKYEIFETIATNIQDSGIQKVIDWLSQNMEEI